MASLKTGGVKMPETRKLCWWSKCVAPAQLRVGVIEFVCVTAYQARLVRIQTIVATLLAISNQMFFVGLISRDLVAPLM